MKRLIALALLGLAACNAAPAPSSNFTVKANVDPDVFEPDEIYGVRHGPSGAVCPGAIDGVPLVRATRGATQGRSYDWCQYTGPAFPQSFNVRVEPRPGETVVAGLYALKASELKEPATWTETAADFTERQASGLTWSKAGSVSHGIWISRAGDWRVAVLADYPEAKRAEVLNAVSDYFRKLRAQ